MRGIPGLLELEDEDGNARKVTADQFVTEAVPPGRMPPVIALASYHTDAAAVGDPSFAARLIARGANVVIGTETGSQTSTPPGCSPGSTVRWPTTRRWTCSVRSSTPVVPCSRSCRAHRTNGSSAWARWASGQC